MGTNLNNQNNEKSINEEKQNKGFLASSLVTILFILIFASISVVSYLPIRNVYFPIEENVNNYIESQAFIYRLSRLTKSLQQSIDGTNDGYDYIDVRSVKYKADGTINEDLSSDGELEQPVNDEKAISNDAKVIESMQKVEEEKVTADTVEIEENVKTTVEEKSLSNMDSVSDDQLADEIKGSLFYMKAIFDENGNPKIETSLGNRFNKDSFIHELIYYDDDLLKEYANLEVVYIVPQDFEEYDDIFTSDMKDSSVLPEHGMLILAIGAISILVLIIVAFAISYCTQNNMAIVKVFNKMFLEFKFIVWFGFIGLCFGTGVIISNNYGHYGYGLTNFIYDVGPAFYIIGITLTFMLYLLIYLSVVYIKHIYHNGFKKGLIENSLFGSVFLYTVRNSKEVFKRLTSINLKEDNYGKLVGIVAVNLLAIWILGNSGFLGFIISLAYTIFIFKYLLKVLNKAKELNKASSKVAEGNFNINVDEDMGILSPMAKDLNNIKQGFSLAIEKEIKSQRMKSELISNVSHDLKTPLTSIINYVDLLKKEDIDEQTRKEYIDILDRKSQRLNVLIEDLFEASKASSGNIELKLENIDTIALFKQTMGELEEKINESTLDFKINLPEDKVTCNLDGRRMYRVFENIIINILKYSMENSRVYIDAIENENEISFIFKNISAYELNFHVSEITERFTRGDESRNTEGSGLGLSIAKSFVELQNGKLEIIIDGDLFKLVVTLPKTK